MNNYLLIAVLVSVFVCIADVLIVDGKNGKLVRSIVSMLCVLAFVEPVLSLFNLNTNNSTNFNVEFTSFLVKTEKETIESEILGLLKLKNYNVISVNAVVDSENESVSTKKVEIILNGNGINLNNEHINITKEVEKLILNNVFSVETGVEIVVEFKNSNWRAKQKN